MAKTENHVAQFELSFLVYTFSFFKVLHVAFYYQEMASVKDKVTETTETPETTVATEVQEVAQVREMVRLTNVSVADCVANFWG